MATIALHLLPTKKFLRSALIITIKNMNYKMTITNRL